MQLFISASNEPSDCLQAFMTIECFLLYGDCREGQIPRPLGRFKFSRSMILEKDSKNLKIWDYLEEEYLYDGKVNLYHCAYDLQKVVSMHGFTFDTVFKQEWVGTDIFSVKSYNGYDGADSVSEYEEFFEYTDDGKKPAYCLGVDNNLGYFIPAMMQF